MHACGRQSTALDLLWDELRRLVEQYKDILNDKDADRTDKLASRVLNSLTEQHMLVFKMDCQHLGELQAAAKRFTHAPMAFKVRATAVIPQPTATEV
jgi:hypothetical protein